MSDAPSNAIPPGQPIVTGWRNYLIRAKLLGLFLFLLILLTVSGFVLRDTVNGSLRVIDKQSVIIQTLQSTSKAEKQFTGLRWAYLRFLGDPGAGSYKSVDNELTAFQSALGNVRIAEMQSRIEDIRSRIAGLEASSSAIIKAKPDTVHGRRAGSRSDA